MTAAVTIVGAFAYRYEPDWMVDDLRANLSWCDCLVELDERDQDVPWSNVADRTGALMELAAATGAEWVFYTSPDERLEDGAGDRLRELAEQGKHDRYRLHLRELWTPDAWRSDGIWGRKRRTRFYRIGTTGKGHNVNLNLYHLKMIDPANRAERARVHTAHNTWDNKGRGFDYMTDETGLVLTYIEEGRGYSPPYRPYTFRVDG